MDNITTNDTDIPKWYLETLEMVQQMDGVLRNAAFELRGAIEGETLDERVRIEMQGFLNALQGIKGRLVLVDMTAREVLDEILLSCGSRDLI